MFRYVSALSRGHNFVSTVTTLQVVPSRGPASVVAGPPTHLRGELAYAMAAGFAISKPLQILQGLQNAAPPPPTEVQNSQTDRARTIAASPEHGHTGQTEAWSPCKMQPSAPKSSHKTSLAQANHSSSAVLRAREVSGAVQLPGKPDQVCSSSCSTTATCCSTPCP